MASVPSVEHAQNLHNIIASQLDVSMEIREREITLEKIPRKGISCSSNKFLLG